jgi:CheY-like chemotaxis protein/anti-sigma regulatory factor (Ser/Thr protein kinase)
MTSTPYLARILIVDDDQGLRDMVAAGLNEAGYETEQAADGAQAVFRLQHHDIDVILLDIGLPRMSGLDVLASARTLPTPPRVVMMTGDDNVDTVLRAVKGQAERYVLKPVTAEQIVDVVGQVLAAPTAAALPIDVVSATPQWVELVAPCSLEAAERIHEFVMHLEADLAPDVRESVAKAFRELLTNAVEWGGKLDCTRKVRISYLRAKRMLLYRIADPGEGFDMQSLSHAAISNPEGDPLDHIRVREEQGLRPGGFGLAMTQALVDELIFNEKRNEVVLVKYLDAPGG